MIDRYAVPVETRAPGGTTNAYVLGGDERLLVDPAGRTDELDAVAASGGVDHVAVTHSHPDHVGAVAAYADEADATVWALAPYADRFEAATDITPDRRFRPGDYLGDSDVTAMYTPGHAADHVAFVPARDSVDEAVAVTGDLVFAEGSVFVGAPDGDVRAYLASLRRLLARDFDQLYPGHGAVVASPYERIRDLYVHRGDREQRILDAVRTGASTVDDIVDAAYTKDITGLRDLAAASVRAHLEKLAVEGRVKWDGERAGPA